MAAPISDMRSAGQATYQPAPKYPADGRICQAKKPAEYCRHLQPMPAWTACCIGSDRRIAEPFAAAAGQFRRPFGRRLTPGVRAFLPTHVTASAAVSGQAPVLSGNGQISKEDAGRDRPASGPGRPAGRGTGAGGRSESGWRPVRGRRDRPRSCRGRCLVREAEALGEPADVRVDADAWYPKGVAEQDIGGLAADAGQAEQGVEVARHLAAEAVDKCLAAGADGLATSVGRSRSARASSSSSSWATSAKSRGGSESA